MCFTRKIYDTVSANVAKEDIIAYKILTKRNKTSPYRNYTWNVGELAIERKFNKTCTSRNIHYGFHLLRSGHDAKYFKSNRLGDRASHAIYEFVIPKGALYFINDTEIVTNKCYLRTGKSVRVKSDTLNKK